MPDKTNVASGAVERKGSAMVSVRLAGSELEAIKRTAADHEETVSGFIRLAALKASGVVIGGQPVMSIGTGTGSNWPVVTSVGSGVIAQISLPGGTALPGPLASRKSSLNATSSQ